MIAFALLSRGVNASGEGLSASNATKKRIAVFLKRTSYQSVAAVADADRPTVEPIPRILTRCVQTPFAAFE